MKRKLPPIIEEVGFDFQWDERKVWQLDLPVENMSIDELIWHFDIPFLWSKPDGYYDLRPRTVMDHLSEYEDENARIRDADESYPIDIMKWKKRWVILDGLHRLMKQALNDKTVVSVRKVPVSLLPKIVKE